MYWKQRPTHYHSAPLDWLLCGHKSIIFSKNWHSFSCRIVVIKINKWIKCLSYNSRISRVGYNFLRSSSLTFHCCVAFFPHTKWQVQVNEVQVTTSCQTVRAFLSFLFHLSSVSLFILHMTSRFSTFVFFPPFLTTCEFPVNS